MMESSGKAKNRKPPCANLRDDRTDAADSDINKKEYLIIKLRQTLHSASAKGENGSSADFGRLKSFKTFEKLLNQLNERKSKRSKLQILLKNWDICLLCLINLGLVFYLIFFICSYLSPQSDYVAKFSELNKQVYESLVDSLIRLDFAEDSVKYEQCALRVPPFALPLLKPIDDCQMCIDLTEIKRVENISKEEFAEKYAYTGVPVIVTGKSDKFFAN